MVLGFVVLLPIHEYIHALAYRIIGASSVSVRYDLRRLTALCVAPDHVMTSAEALFVRLTPVLILNAVLATLTFVAPPGRRP